ncbi:MAG TPA: glycosyltransferase family 2 protein [Anaerolineaceae bacterium]|nr:glycosyltransferase family 2 protein [Anaerolineaceae bacterium]
MSTTILHSQETIQEEQQLFPFVSIVMPVRNEVQYIKKAIKAVLDQDYPADAFEVLVADGMSIDGTREVVQSFFKDAPQVVLIDNPGKIVPTGLNKAIEQARGEIIIRVDGHCVIARDYVRKSVAYLKHDPQLSGVGGPMETIGETPVSAAIAAAMSSSFGVGGSAFRTKKDQKLFVETVAFPAYKASTLHQAGPFDEELVRNQDDEYNYRIREMGGKILLAPDIHSRYYSRGSLRSLWRQYFQYGFWKVRVMQKHPRQVKLRQYVPPLFVLGTAGSALFTLVFPGIGKYLLGVVLGGYAAANLTASLLTAARSGLSNWFVLPAAFATLHYSYGLGFLVGLVKFARCWNIEKNQWGSRKLA